MKFYKCMGLTGLLLWWMTGVSLANLPKNVKITNVTQNQFAISWITDEDEIGYIIWGTNTDSLSERGLDDRDNIYGTPTIKDDTHHITIATSTIAATFTYYYQIVSGTQTSELGSITTGANIIPPSGEGVYGYVYKWGPLPATGTIVYFYLEGSASTSALRSVLIISPDGGWAEFLGNFRTLDLSNFFTYSDNDDLCIYVEGATDGTASLRLKISESKPTPDIIIPPDITPPDSPTVTDDGTYTANNTYLHAKWVSNDTESGIREYEYAIGTTQGGTETVDWTSVGTETEVTKTGLNLVHNNIYYFSVKAKNMAGLWSNIGFSDGIKVGYALHLAAKIPVYPNPFIFRKSNFITFGGLNESRLTKEVTIKIFTLAGELVHQIDQTNCNGQIEWTPPHNLASGIYIYLITNPIGERVKGKLGIMK